MLDAIITGVISGVMGYLLPQPAWAKALQMLFWEWAKKKLGK